MKRISALFILAAFTIHLAPAQQADRFGLRLIAVRTEAEAARLLDRLQSGERFADLARLFSIEPSAALGGYIGIIAVADLRPEFREALKGIEPGRVSKAVQAGGAFFLLQITPDEESRSAALMEAALSGDDAKVKALLDAGTDINARYENGLTVLMNAAFAGRTSTVRVLIAGGAHVHASLNDGSTALMAAALGGHADIVKALIDAGADARVRSKTGTTALMEAAHAGHVEVTGILLQQGADVNASLGNGSTALMAAALGGHVDILRALVKAGARLDAKDSRGWTALTHAAASTKTAAVKALVEMGAGADAADAKDRHVVLGSTYVNEFYSSNDPNLLTLAATEFQHALQLDTQNAAAYLWAGAIEVLRWNEKPGIEQFRKANDLLRRSAALEPKDPERHYWVAATNSMFATRATGLSDTESAAILDEGIEYARKATELDRSYAEAAMCLKTLYLQRAQHATSTEQERFIKFADAAHQDVVRLTNSPPRPTDQFSKPAAPSPPSFTSK